MLSISFIKKEKIKMDSFKDKLEKTNLEVLNEIDKFFDKQDKRRGFKFKTLNKFFIQNGFAYDNEANCFCYSAYNPSIRKTITVNIYDNCIIYECGLLSSTNLYEIPEDSTEEDARTRVMDYLNKCADNFINTLKEYANAHGGVILDKEEDEDNEQ